MSVCSSTLLFLQRISMPKGVSIDHVACGSAHTMAWSSMKGCVSYSLPQAVPVEFNLLQDLPVHAMKDRLVLLHHFSTMLCKSLSLFMLQPGPIPSPSAKGDMFPDFSLLKGCIISSAKVTMQHSRPSCFNLLSWDASSQTVRTPACS